MDIARVVEGLIDPSGIAIVGASENRYYARSIIKNLANAGFPADRIFPVNPRYETVAGLPCFASLTAIGQPFSLVVAATGRDTIPGIVGDAGATGAQAVLVLADGYAEQDAAGKALQEELGAHQVRSGVAVVGPNTLGYIAPATGAAVWAPGVLTEPLTGGSIGIVFQSSGMLNLMVNLCITRNLGVRAAFSVGNEVGVRTADLIAFMARDAATKVIVTMVETTEHPRDLARALEAARVAGKPVVMLKLGRSERARRNAIAHTGRMATGAATWNAMLSRLGVVVVDDLDELVECAALFDRALAGRPSRFEAAVVTVSGGDCSLIADLSHELGVPLAELQPASLTQLVKLLDKPNLVGNPLDVENLQREDEARFYEAIDVLCQDPSVDLVAYRMYLPTAMTASVCLLYENLVARTRAAGKLPVVVTRAIEDLDRDWYAFFSRLGVAFLPGYRASLASLARLAAWGRRRTPDVPISLDAVPDSIRTAGQSHMAGWRDTQSFLADAGVPYATARLVKDAADAVIAAGSMGYPVAVKLFSRAAAHKSDIGGVVLGIRDAEQLALAVEQIQSSAEAHGVSVEGFEVQRMAAPGVEMIVGVTSDPVLGPIVMVGMGGVLSEVTHDVVLLLPDVSEGDVLDALTSLTGYPLLQGYRGRPEADAPALCALVASLSRHVAAHPDSLVELDLNPVIVLAKGNGVVVVDAVLVVGDGAAGGSPVVPVGGGGTA